MNITEIATPAYVIDEQKLLDNLKILSDIAKESGAKILLAQKAFSAYSTYPLIAEYLQGATASGLYEARLAYEEMIKPFEGKKKLENHVFEPAFKDEEFPLVCEVADHIVFNSIAQFEHHRNVWEKAAAKKLLSVGLRINPEFSTQEGHEIYDPCAPGSRLGIRKENLPNPLPSGVEGLHFHTLCEQGFEPLEATFKEVEQDFGEFFAQIKWINLGGGHHITKPDYDREGLKELIRYIKEKPVKENV